MEISNEELHELFESARTKYYMYCRQYINSISEKGITSELIVIRNLANYTIGEIIVICMKMNGIKDTAKDLAKTGFGIDWP